MEKYGEDWVNHRLDSADNIQVKLNTYAEYEPLFKDENFIIIRLFCEKGEVIINEISIEKIV